MRHGPIRSMMARMTGSAFFRCVRAFRMVIYVYHKIGGRRTENEYHQEVRSERASRETDLRILRPRPETALAASNFSRRRLESNSLARRIWRRHLFLDCVDEALDDGLVNVQASFQFGHLAGEFAVGAQHLAQANKGAHHKYTHLDGLL